jgi:hypothetical protein
MLLLKRRLLEDFEQALIQATIPVLFVAKATQRR